MPRSAAEDRKLLPTLIPAKGPSGDEQEVPLPGRPVMDSISERISDELAARMIGAIQWGQALKDLIGNGAHTVPSRAGLLLFGALILGGCDDFRYPRDAEDTLERVLAEQSVRVAVASDPPWVRVVDDVPVGVEARLVEAFALEIGAAIEWQNLSQVEALEAVERGDADLAIGGFTQRSVNAIAGAPTYPYFSDEVQVAALPDAIVPTDLDGARVFVPPDLLLGGYLDDEDAVAVSSLEESDGLMIVHEWKIPGSQLRPTNYAIRSEKHVMAVPKGENAWLMRLETFLREKDDVIVPLLQEFAP
ncbi:ABC transporter substrate-binding protein [Aurantimonas sp. HBX-1]|uniref:substrate-binding periplasmic protein n=1 Tax=Aurantimonas sp. HBX-1 TaxID=2906072 RepID=UPI001F226C31|nr:transporter substrate-binding domain-containing protein [Aurantimonas sp. HBX-1]UIJ73330.1 transporter substrate-binding domain-containing protein [Aurantimonas sp. HBX-1]